MLPGWAAEHLLEHVDDRVRVHRLCDYGVGAALDELLLVRGHGVAGDCEDDPAVPLRAQVARRLVPVQDRHGAVHENDVVAMLWEAVPDGR